MHRFVVGFSKRNFKPVEAARLKGILCLLLCVSSADAVHFRSRTEQSGNTSSALRAAGSVATQSESPELTQGRPVEREIAGGESHSYRITLKAGQYLNVTAEQRVDVEIKLLAPDGKLLAAIDWQGKDASESLWALMESPGDYRLEVVLPNKLAKTGQYVVKIEKIGEWQDATPREKNIVTAHKLFLEASKLRDERKAESLQNALATYNKSLLLWRGERDLLGEANTLNEMGFLHSRLGEREKALGYYQQALALFHTFNKHRDVTLSLNNVGSMFSLLGNPQKALEHLEEALSRARAQGNPHMEASALNNIREVYNRTGEFQKALDYGFQALILRRALGERQREAVVLNNIGALYQRLGESQKALNYLFQSLAIRRALRDHAGEGTTITNIATVYINLGELQKALSYLDQALALRRSAGDRAGEAYTLNTIGICHLRLAEYSKALDYFNKSVALNRAVGDSQGIIFATNNIGIVYGQAGDLPEALNYHNQALALSRSAQNRPAESLALGNIGAAYSKLKEPQKALEHLNKALLISETIGNQSGRAVILRDIAQAERDLGWVDAARSRIETALEIIESTRGKVASPDLRSSYLASNQSYYKFHIDLLMQMYEQNSKSELIIEALHSSERQRARSLLDLLSEAGMDIRRGIDPELKKQERSIHTRISELQSQLIQTYSGAKPDQNRIVALEKELKEVESKREELQDRIKQKFSQYASIQYPTPIGLKSIQQLLDDRTALLEYSLGEEASFLFVISKSEFQAIRLPSAASIAGQVLKLREAIAAEPDQMALPKYFLSARSLYKELIQPAQKTLDGKRSLIIVPDGILYYLPFETLLKPLPNIPQGHLSRLPYLIRDYAISYVPSASVLASLLNDSKQRETSQKKFLAYADPVYTAVKPDEYSSIRSALDNTFGQSRPWKLQSLAYSREEVERIAKLYPHDQTSLFLREQASEENVKTNDRLNQYQYIHFAVHGLLNEKIPQYSGLILSLRQSKKDDSADTQEQTGMGKEILSTQDSPQIEDGLLQVYEIFDLKLNADLVVLSACETGLGKEVKGEGMIGLTRAFLYAGARSLVVSLWKVEDRSTAQLMEKFYRFAGNKSMSKSEALRQAQLELIRNTEFSHPYRWAGFTLVGTP